MKRLLTFFCTLFFSCSAFSQSQNDYSYSIGFKLFGYGEYPKLMNEARGADNYRSSSFNSFLFKFNDNQISYRIVGTKYSNDDFTFNNVCKDCEVVKGQYKDFSVKIGFERNLLYGPIQPYYGLDMGFRKINFDGTSVETATNFTTDIAVEKNGMIIYPMIGFKVNLIKSRLTFAAEMGMDILYSHDKETRTDNANNIINLANFRRWGFYNQPLGQVTVQFNFGN